MGNFYQQFFWICTITALCLCIVSYKQIPTAGQKESKKLVWVLYFAHWGNFETDGRWVNWRIKRGPWLDHYFEPPISVPSLYFPQLGFYSSHNKVTIKKHLKMLSEIHADALIIEWNGPKRQQSIETEPGFIDESLDLLIKAASKTSIKIGVILSDYINKSSDSEIEDINYFLNKYQKDCLKVDGKPVIFVNGISNLSTIFHNVTFIGYGNTLDDALDSYENGFGGYTSYSPTKVNTWMQKPENWLNSSTALLSRNFIFIPSISPGINETAFNVQYVHRSRSRNNGKYYDSQWKAAIATGADIFLVDSFNNWFDGTVIEPVLNNTNFPLNDNIWTGSDSFYYLRKTERWIHFVKDM